MIIVIIRITLYSYTNYYLKVQEMGDKKGAAGMWGTLNHSLDWRDLGLHFIVIPQVTFDSL